MKTLILSCFSRPRWLAALAALGLFAITAQAQTVTWTSSNPAVATVDASGVVSPVSAGTATITAAIIQNGKTVTSNKTIEVNLGPPSITVNGVKWAQGNVTYDPTSCANGTCTKLMIAEDPYDCGLFFQWYGGTSGGVVIGYPKSNGWNYTPRYVQPGGKFPSSWPESNGIYNSYQVNKGDWTANNPCTLIGGSWRMPTKEELISLHPSGTETGAGSWNITGWTSSTYGLEHNVTGFILAFGGYYETYGSLRIGAAGTYWASTQYDANSASFLYIGSGGLNVGIRHKPMAFQVRCVKD